ncbi:ice-binding family protein, partial [Herbiconiux sp.]|uniref:ice-binding family protein n=1 Tax=Herbiconiux sp. TaxID=1871186 RepID=UPI0025BF87F6
MGLTLVVATVSIAWLGSQSASAAATSVDLGTAGSYSVLGGQSVTNTGPSVLSGDLGVSPGTAVSGFPPGLVGGASHVADAQALQAQSDLVVAYDAAAGEAPDESIAGDIGGTTILPGVYKADSSILLTGPLTLDAQGDPDAVFVFQIGSSLTTATSSSVVTINGADSCNVFWQIGSSATLGTSTAFKGSILALTSISTGSGTTIDGRALARNGSVTLINTVFTDASCTTTPPTTEPPETIPPVTNPPVTNPPVTNPPVTNPPVTNPPVTNPPVTNPPVTNPPVTNPPVTNPPVTNPPVTNLPVT